MRHKKSFNHLGRKKGHRRAMLANMASSLIVHKRITTTLAKAKALRSYVEPLITKSKDDATHSRRVVFSYLNDKDATAELFREVSPKVAERPGGYTRIIKLAPRLGDSADMAMIELVDFNELLVKEAKPKRSRRSRRGGSSNKTETAAPVTETKTDVTSEDVAATEEVTVETPEDQVETTPATEAKADVEEAVEEVETPTAEEPKTEDETAPEAKAEDATAEEAPKEQEDGDEGEDKKEA